MYVSKYFTCTEIDQRLKQGYYDDFVSAGFVGTIEEFWAFVLSIKDKPGTESVKSLLSDLETKLQGLIDGVQNNLDTTEGELNGKIDQSVTDLEQKLEAQKVTKVSQLENDANYQTEAQVKAFISALVNGADESLDTLLELAEALGNDPNFAATVTEKLGQLKKAIEDEATRATAKETELKGALDAEIAKREEGDANVIKLTEQHIDRISQSLTDSFNGLDQKIQTLNSQYQNLLTSFHDLSTEVNAKVEAAKQEAKDDNATLKTELEKAITDAVNGVDEKIDAEITRATGAEQALDARVTELNETHTNDVAALQESIANNQKAIQDEANARVTGDQALETKLAKEIADRANADSDLQSKITQESLDRLQGDSDLQTGLTQEIADRKASEADIKSQISIEKTARETADINLGKDIEQLETKHDNELSTLTQKLDAEIARAKTAEGGKVDKVEGKGLSTNDFTNALLEKINGIQEHANYVTKVSELLNDANYQTQAQVEAAIQSIIGTAPDVLDTLQEISEALGNDPNFAGTIMNRLASITTQLNEEVENRGKADDTLKLELLAEIKKATDSMGNSYAVLEERLNTYKSLSDQKDTELDGKITALTNTLNEKVALFLEKVTELSDKYTEKVNELNVKVNQFTTDILARLSAQDDLINGNTANIQRNLEFIQGLTGEITGIKDTHKKDFNSLLQAIRDEADTRKAADDALTTKVDTNTQKLAATAQSLEELEQYVNNLPSVKGSSTISAIPKEDAEGRSQTELSVIVDANDPILTKEPTGLKSNLGIKKTQKEDNSLTYELTGKDGQPIQGVTSIDIPEVNPFTEAESQAMYNDIYGH